MTDPVEFRRPLLAAWRVSIAVAAAIAGSGVALAQEAGDTELEDVVVTGSRIIREGMSSPTPVTSVSADELLQVNPQSISQALASLPAMTGSTTPKSIGGRTTLGPGSFLNLRNLGNNRNLVLLDGRRLVPANIAGNTDINLLPQGLIQNVSVVTGGASAAYGSDAMAGVTNFTLNTRFEGLKIDANGGISTRDDGGGYRLALAGGKSFLDGRLHVIGSFDWRNSAQAYKENRDWARNYCATIGIPGVNAGNQSDSNPRQTIACNVTQPIASYGGAILSGPLVAGNQPIQFDDQGNPVPFNYGSLRGQTLMVGGSGNYVGDTANFNTPTDNKVYFGHVTYDVSDSVEAFVQGTYATADSDYTQTPPYFYSTTPLNIQTGNAFLPASIQDRMTALTVNSFALGIVPKSWGNIDITSGYATWDIVGGLKGTLANNWTWDVYYEQGRSAFRLDYHDQISMSRLYRAVDAVRAPNGSIVCQSALVNPALYGNCVPLNPFGDRAPSRAALDYIHGAEQPWNYNIMRQKAAAASISGELFSTWTGPVVVGGGVEYRELNGEILSDAGSSTVPDWTNIRGLPASLPGRVGDWSTSNVQPTDGEYNVKEAFAETLVPLARGRNLLYSLDLNAAFRVTDYSQSGTVNTWKVGLSYRPIEELLLRGTRSRDIRAPGIGDLYTRDSSGPDIIIDDVINGTGQRPVAVIISGNPDLNPEKGDTWTAGFTYQPKWLGGFAMSADYYDIQIKDMLASVGGQEVVLRCSQGQAAYCANLVGPPSAFTGIRSRTMNLSQARTQGVDLDLNYRTQLLGNNTLFRVVATRLIEQSTTVPNATTSVYTDRAGDIGIGYPKWVANALVNVDIGPLGLNANARYIHKGARNTTWVPGDIAPQFRTIGSVTTFDVGARYGLAMTGEPELYLNIQNVFDRDPPLVPSSALVGGQTNVGLYDTMGRYFTMGVRLQF
ncbi:MAG: TonB-dependent receptor [Pseudomonadota bacterium]|nr:TonB-dependent receptor [Pseudomonadota bacterium]